ncbi:MAG: SGNH/GDSL hydrolase family protein [Acidobacteria bacterium]|nr:MAG: SGNH/GDSL hydrolase family protein [Acidobacteriota bacterium]
MTTRRVWYAVLLAAAVLAACGSDGEGPTGPSPIPPANSTVNYTAIGASDAIGVGASVFCAPYVDCPDGRGYVHVTTRALMARGFNVNLVNLGFPGTVLSRRLQALGAQYGRDIPGNFVEQQLPFIASTQTLITIFAGANDVETIIAALGGGAGGADQTGYINSQIQLFGQELNSFVRSVRERAPSARVIVLNLPNMAGMPKFTALPVARRRAAQSLSVGMTTTVINPLAATGALVIDLMCDARSYQASTYWTDGFHPSDAGYAWMAAEVVAATTTAYRAPTASCAPMTIVN